MKKVLPILITAILISVLISLSGCQKPPQDTTEITVTKAKNYSLILKDGWEHKTSGNALILFDSEKPDVYFQIETMSLEGLYDTEREVSVSEKLTIIKGLDFNDGKIELESYKLRGKEVLQMTVVEDGMVYMAGYYMVDDVNVYIITYPVINEGVIQDIEEMIRTIELDPEAVPTGIPYVTNYRIINANNIATNIYVAVDSACSLLGEGSILPFGNGELTADEAVWTSTDPAFDFVTDFINERSPNLSGRAVIFTGESVYSDYGLRAVAWVVNGNPSSVEFDYDTLSWKGMDEQRPGHDTEGNLVGLFPTNFSFLDYLNEDDNEENNTESQTQTEENVENNESTTE